MNGALGIGAQRTLAGLDGLDIVYWVGRIQLNGTIHLYYHKPDADTSSGGSGLDLGLAVGALFPFLSSENVELAIGGRLSFATADPGGTQIGLEAPLQLLWFVTPHFSIHGEVGIVIELVPDEGSNITPPGVQLGNSKGTGFFIGATGVAGGAGFDFIF